MKSAFSQCSSLSEIVFIPNSHIKKIAGFSNCFSLSRIEIPAPVEIIAQPAFSHCSSLNEVVVIRDSHVKKIAGFSNCFSL
jgi:hypothetical protein